MFTRKQAYALAEEWTREPFDAATREEVAAMLEKDDETAIMDRFSMEMEFGTAGLRGIMGPGIFYMNEYTIAHASRGLADCLNALYPEARDMGVVIGFDCRHNSEKFAQITAAVIAAAGIKVYLYQKLGPTPLVPFAVRRLRARAGIMITSSHNPREYNGYKVYQDNGAQIISPLDRQISGYISKVGRYTGIDRLPLDEAEKKGCITMLGNEAVALYTEWAAKTACLRNKQRVKVLYTPLHGTGYDYVRETFDRIGFKELHVVPEQRDPDGDFPTVSAPNPEKRDAMELAMHQAAAMQADLILATDGDSDRIGAAVRDRNGNYLLLNGNQIGTVMLYYILSHYKEQGKINSKQFAVASVVSSPLTGRLCEYFGINFHRTLTGFKWMGNVSEEMVQAGGEFILAYEEAFGVTFFDSRDKDGVISIALMAEAAAWCRANGRTLLDLIDEMYLNCDLYTEGACEKFYEGASGKGRMGEIMERLRTDPPREINGTAVVRFDDVLDNRSVENGTPCAPLDLPSQDLMIFTMADRSWIAVRPSGTEPKIKAYLGTIQAVTEDSLAEQKEKQKQKIAAIQEAAAEMLE